MSQDLDRIDRWTAVATHGFGALGHTLDPEALERIAGDRTNLTYLAPTRDAIAAIGVDEREDWATPAGRERLAALVQGHVLAGAQALEPVAAGAGVIESMAGTQLVVERFGGALHVGEAAVVGRPVEVAWTGDGRSGAGGPGGTHVVLPVDAVLSPPTKWLQTLRQRTRLAADPAERFDTLLTLIDALPGEFGGGGPLTVFAPTDGAFAADPDFDPRALLAPNGHADLLGLLARHAVHGPLSIGAGLARERVFTLDGQPLFFTDSERSVTVGGAPLARGNVLCSDGAIHVVGELIH